MTTPESDSLAAARKHLARAEARYQTDDGLYDLEEGLALLQTIALDGEPQHRTVATNLLETYSGKICDAVKRTVDSDRQLPEPALKHLFDVLLAFDAVDLELPEYVRTLKIEVVKRLIDLYYEGYPEAEKQKMLGQLAGITK